MPKWTVYLRSGDQMIGSVTKTLSAIPEPGDTLEVEGKEVPALRRNGLVHFVVNEIAPKAGEVVATFCC
jgi:hypothetical protein